MSKSNYPKFFKICPQCKKKGLYARVIDYPEECCKYCSYHGKISTAEYWKLRLAK